MKKIVWFLLGTLLIMNLVDAGTTYFSFRNNLDVAEIGLLGEADGTITNIAICIHLFFSILIMTLCFWLNLKIDYTKKTLPKLLFIALSLWTLVDIGVAINNILVILSVT